MQPGEQPETTQNQEPDSFGVSGFAEETNSSENETTESSSDPLVAWSASEYISHQKSAGWYIALIVASLLAAGMVLLITSDWVTFGVILVVASLFGVFAARKPQVLDYQVYPAGIVIHGKEYHFDDFKSFAVHAEAALPSVYFMPVKRFMPGLSVYFPPDQGEKIVQTLSDYLPRDDKGPDPVDRLMKRVRF